MSRPVFTYECTPWGETIHATKEQLQSFGIGKERLFPGEPGGPRRPITVTDPRGYRAEIRDYVDGWFIVNFTYPRREYAHIDHTPARANLRAIPSEWMDKYVGTAEAIVAAGLVLADKFPGLPGCPKVRTTLLPDGTIAKGAAHWRAHLLEGAKQITKVSKSTYRVTVRLSEAEKQRRQLAAIEHRREWEAQWRDEPTPAPLHAVYSEMHRLAMLPRELPRSETAERFKATISKMAEFYLRALRTRFDDAAYCIAPASLTLIDQAAEQLHEAMLSAVVLPVSCDEEEPVGTLHNGFWLRTAS